MKMQQTIGVFAAGVFLISALAMNASCESAVDPSSPQIAAASLPATIIVDPPLIKLGFIEPRSTITRNFRLINSSTKPVTIQSATPTCTCTTIEAQGKIIPPGQSLELPLTMKVAASTGIKSAAVTFTFAGGIAPVTIEMSGEIAYAVRGTTTDVTNGAMVPYINAFQDPSAPAGTPPAPLSGTVTISSIDRSLFRINSVMGQPAGVVNFTATSICGVSIKPWHSDDGKRAAFRVRTETFTRMEGDFNHFQRSAIHRQVGRPES